MKDKIYHNQLAMSVASFVAREELRGKTVEENVEYPISLVNELTRIEMKVLPKKARQTIESVPEIIQSKLNKNFSSELTQEEEMLSYLDATMAEKYMKRNFNESRLPETINCAQRTIDNLELLNQYSPNFDKQGIAQTIKNAQKFKRGAYIIIENPIHSFFLIEMEASIEEGDFKECQKIKEELEKTPETQLIQ